MVLANAGIDRSNVDGRGDDDRVLLLPADPDASAAAIRDRLRAIGGAAVGVIIADSIGRAWRLGTIGTAIGAAGVTCLADLRGKPDLNGRPLETTEVGAADELAAAASLLMGQAAEGTPVVVIRGAAGVLGEGRAADLVRPVETDMFR
jgi:coenzyme F420-0:L-glutamate ligase/coenzyme F420-1:gamma-L-glutamate ligase